MDDVNKQSLVKQIKRAKKVLVEMEKKAASIKTDKELRNKTFFAIIAFDKDEDFAETASFCNASPPLIANIVVDLINGVPGVKEFMATQMAEAIAEAEPKSNALN